MNNDYPERSLSPPEAQVFDYCYECKGEIYWSDDAYVDTEGIKTVCETCASKNPKDYYKYCKRNVYIRRYR